MGTHSEDRRGPLRRLAKHKIRRRVSTESRSFATQERGGSLCAQVLKAALEQAFFVSRREAELKPRYEALDTLRARNHPRVRRREPREKPGLNLWRNSALAARSLAGLRGLDVAKWRDAR